jgi:hypothetical protein
MLDHFQLYALLCSRVFNSVACVALIHVSQLDVLLRDLLYLPGQLASLCPVLFPAGVTCKAGGRPSVSTATWTFDPLRRLAPVSHPSVVH